MTYYDLFNGDADGICALQQLRLQTPLKAVRITGLKRDTRLLSQIAAKAGDEITVLDISLDKNRKALKKTLMAGAKVFYADHHCSTEIPQHDNLNSHIDTAANTCTSLIINQYLGGLQPHWAVVGAFGDNLDASAIKLGKVIGLTASELLEYRQLGACLNYNSYGFEVDDLMYHPDELFCLVNGYQRPLDLIRTEPAYQALCEQYQTDRKRSKDLRPDMETSTAAIYFLPSEPWARRIIGVMGNEVAKKYPDRAHALLIDMGDRHYRVSVRAPYRAQLGADLLCRQFESGGGRKAAGGIDRLPEEDLVEFSKCFHQSYSAVR